MVSRGIWESQGESGGWGSGRPALPPAGVHGSHTTELLHGSEQALNLPVLQSPGGPGRDYDLDHSRPVMTKAGEHRV